jgi:hypothetical protein
MALRMKAVDPAYCLGIMNYFDMSFEISVTGKSGAVALGIEAAVGRPEPYQRVSTQWNMLRYYGDRVLGCSG